MNLERRDYILAGAIVALLIGSILLGYFAFREDKEKASDLRVDDVYFKMEGANSQRSQIKIVVFISNIGNEDVGKLHIRAFTVETGSNLAMDDSTTTINDVKQQTTVEGNLLVDIPNNDSYRMELLIFKDDKLEIRGSGTIDLTDVGASYDYRDYPLYDNDYGDGASMADEAAAFSWFGGACLFLMIVGVIIGIIIFAVYKTKKDERTEAEFFRDGPYPPPRHSRRTEPRLEEFDGGSREEPELERGPRERRPLELGRKERPPSDAKEDEKEH
ncbi:MAG: hypothetical protein ACMUHU_03125 [Thermoplasmatota archaeon]